MTTDNTTPVRGWPTWRTGLVVGLIAGLCALALDALLVDVTPTGFVIGPREDVSEISLGWVLGMAVVGLVLGWRPWRTWQQRRGDRLDVEGPWRADVGRLDRARVAWAVTRYDFWLDWYDTPRGRRAPARRELRANLQAAAEHSSAVQAIADLGDIRVLAAETVAGLRPRVAARMTAGIVAAGVTLIVLEVLLVASLFAFADGAMATGVAGEVEGTVLGLPSTVEWGPQGFSVGSEFSPLVFLVPLLVFVVVAKPWRLRTRGAARREQG